MLASLVSGCDVTRTPPGKTMSEPVPSTAASTYQPPGAEISPDDTKAESAGAMGTTDAAERPASAIEGFRKAATGVYSGGEPKTREAFAELQRQGVKTIVSVDGAKPSVDLAHEFGMRYVHIPIGYDGIPSDAQGALVEVMKRSERPLFIHCHHGKHRGPAAVALACRAAGLLDAGQAKKLMEDAGTSADYKGLWRDVEAFQPPSAGDPAPVLVETSEVSAIAGAMAMIDRAFDRMKVAQKAGWPGDETSNAENQSNALVIAEGFDESLRDAPRDRQVDLTRRLEEARRIVEKLQLAIIDRDLAGRDEAFKQLDVSCKSCHKAHRD